MKKFRLLFSMLAATAVMFTACQPGAETPEDPNPDQGTETPDTPGSGETPDTPDTPVTPAGPTVVEFYADATMGQGSCNLDETMALPMAVGLPGHWLVLRGLNSEGHTIEARLLLLDYSVDAMSYQYLALGDYPVVAGNIQGETCPTTSCLLANPELSNFYNYDTGVAYTVVVPETAAGADGMPYGVSIQANPSVTMQDLNYLLFNIPVVDDNGNPAVVQGAYTGNLGYQLGGGGAQQTLPFDLGQYGFTTFEATYNQSANMLVLASSSMNGNLRLNFDLDTTNGLFLDQAFECVQGGGALSGFFWEQMGDVDYTVDSGRIVVSATETPGQYTLTVSPRNPVVFWGQRFIYELQGDYTVTINGLPEGL